MRRPIEVMRGENCGSYCGAHRLPAGRTAAKEGSRRASCRSGKSYSKVDYCNCPRHLPLSWKQANSSDDARAESTTISKIFLSNPLLPLDAIHSHPLFVMHCTTDPLRPTHTRSQPRPHRRTTALPQPRTPIQTSLRRGPSRICRVENRRRERSICRVVLNLRDRRIERRPTGGFRENTASALWLSYSSARIRPERSAHSEKSGAPAWAACVA
ncbi:hypothetical protein QFZ98_001653 [Paraburkholderia youngii]